MPQIKFVNHKSLFINRRTGFTLIELLIVITIIGILVAAGIYSWQSAQLKGRDNRRKTDIKTVQQALENYFQINGKYPSTTAGTTGGVITCNISGSTNQNPWGGPFTCGTNTYIQRLPTDPTLQTLGYYYDNPTFATYNIYAKLENTKDFERVANCGPGGRDYCVKNP